MKMRSKGSRFTLGVWELRVCSLNVVQPFTTVRDRSHLIHEHENNDDNDNDCDDDDDDEEEEEEGEGEGEDEIDALNLATYSCRGPTVSFVCLVAKLCLSKSWVTFKGSW